MHTRKLLTAAAVFTIAAGAAFSARAAEPLSRYGFYFDTLITISLYDSEDASILDRCFRQMADFENTLSRTREGSDIWNINHSGGAPVEVSDDTLVLLEDALEYCKLSDGALDVTIAPVVDLWDFHEDSDRHIPAEDVLAEAASHVDYHCVEISGHTVRLTDPEAEIDLGCIAKGYISDRLRDTLLEEGVTSALIDLGGNVRTVGTKPDGSPWRIGIRKPFGETAMDMVDIVAIKDKTVITSGTYERYFIVDDTLYHHILDPETGYPVENELDAVSIVAPDGSDGDALSTTCFALGTKKGLDLIESLDGIEALFIGKDGKLTQSSGWPSAN